jgi:hypothetical protein
MGKEKSAYVFLKDPDYAWIPAKLLRSSGNVADVQIPEYPDEQATICDGGKSAKKMIDAEVDLTDYNRGVLPMQNVDENGRMRTYSDMVELPFLHEVSLFEFCYVIGTMKIFLKHIQTHLVFL